MLLRNIFVILHIHKHINKILNAYKCYVLIILDIHPISNPLESNIANLNLYSKISLVE